MNAIERRAELACLLAELRRLAEQPKHVLDRPDAIGRAAIFVPEPQQAEVA